MAFVLIGLAVGAGFALDWQAVAIVNCVLAVWSNGVIANYGVHESGMVPDWASFVSLLTALASVVMVVVGLV